MDNKSIDVKNDEKKEKEKKDVSVKKRLFSNLDGKILLVNVGNEKNQASEEDIKRIEEKVLKMLNDNNINCAVFVTDHTVDMRLLN